MTDHLLYNTLGVSPAIIWRLTPGFQSAVLVIIAAAAFIYHRVLVGRLTEQQALLNGRLKESEELLSHSREKEIKAKEEITAAHRSTTALLTKLSHEIRTPMNGVIGMTSLLSGTPLNTEQMQQLNSISTCSESLIQSINDILSEYALQTGSNQNRGSEREKLQQSITTQSNAGFSQLSAAFSSEYPLRILVGEDNPMNQELISMILKRLGYSADIAQNGKEVTDILNEHPYDLIFMDVQMPEMDGLEATRTIRRRLNVQPVIIAMTANAMPGDREECIRAGMDDYISKPLNLEELVSLLERWAPHLNKKANL